MFNSKKNIDYRLSVNKMVKKFNTYPLEYLGDLVSQSKMYELDDYLFKARSIEPKELSYYLWSVISKLKQSQYCEAYLYALMSCDLFPSSAEAYALKALVLEKENKFLMAKKALEHAIYLNPLDAVYLYRLKKILFKLGQSDLYIDQSIRILSEEADDFSHDDFFYEKNRIKNQKISNIIDVIIPVYADYEITKKCIESVLKSISFNRFLNINILVINDASLDKKINEFLFGLNGKIELIVNPYNMGFIKTINKGFRFHPDRDVVLLNSDTYVEEDWLKRLHHIAYSEEKIATVTPFSNNAELVSFPTPMKNNKLANIETTVKVLDSICKLVNKGDIVDIPTGVGFCMYIRRDALNDIGFLDEHELQRGYGEEVDLCFRFRKEGWRNICACNVFVAHIGECSFKNEKRIRVIQNLKVLYKKYPSYKQEYDFFLKKDKLKKYRNKIEVSLLEKNNEIYTLILSPPKGWKNFGMVDARFTQAISLNKYIYLYKDERITSDNNIFYLSEDREIGYRNLSYNWSKDKETFRKHLVFLNINCVEIYELRSFNKDLLDLLIGLNVKIKLFVSDFSLICQLGTLVNYNNVICDTIPEEKNCQYCLDKKDNLNFFMKDLNNNEYRIWMRSFVKKIVEFNVDTEEIKKRIEKQFKSLYLKVKRYNCLSYLNFSSFNVSKNEALLVLVLFSGYDKREYTKFVNLIKYIIKNELLISFVKIGFSPGDYFLKNTNKVKVFSNSVFEDSNLDEFITSSGVDAIIDMCEAPKANYSYIKKLLHYELPLSLSENIFPDAWSKINHLKKRKPDLNLFDFNKHIFSICKK